MTEWKIQSRSNACQSCGKTFADKDAYYTLLFDKRHNLDRLDVCPECWTSQYSQGANDRKGFVSFWHGVFTVPPPPPPEAIQKESAESLLRKLMELNDPQYQAACFILAVMMERKRIFRVKTQSVQDSRRVLCYEHPKSGDLFTIVDPGLQLDQLAAVQLQVAELLEHGLHARDAMPVASATAEELMPPAEDAAVDTEISAPVPVETPPVEAAETIEKPSPATGTEAPANV
jgi:hypothetical protein